MNIYLSTEQRELIIKLLDERLEEDSDSDTYDVQAIMRNLSNYLGDL